MMELDVTPKDCKLLSLLSHGMDQDAAARHLGLSHGAVVARLRVLKVRLSANSTTHLVAIALRTKLIK